MFPLFCFSFSCFLFSSSSPVIHITIRIHFTTYPSFSPSWTEKVLYRMMIRCGSQAIKLLIYVLFRTARSSSTVPHSLPHHRIYGVTGFHIPLQTALTVIRGLARYEHISQYAYIGILYMCMCIYMYMHCFAHFLQHTELYYLYRISSIPPQPSDFRISRQAPSPSRVTPSRVVIRCPMAGPSVAYLTAW